MLAEMIPECPRLHHGIMAVDPDEKYGVEFVCRVCGTRIYPNEPESIIEIEPVKHNGKGIRSSRRIRRIAGYIRIGKLSLKIWDRPPGSCVECGRQSDTHLLCRTCRRKDR